jgi:hypothetical protein
VNQPRHWKPLQRLITLSWLYFTFKNSLCNGCNGNYNGTVAIYQSPLQWQSTAPLQAVVSHCNG